MKHQIHFALLALLSVLLLTGCGSKPVIDYSSSTNFNQYQSFQWQANSQSEAIKNDLILIRIQRAVAAELPQRGLQLVSNNPDLIVDIRNSGTATVQKEAPRGGIGLGSGGGNVGVGLGLSIPIGEGKQANLYKVVIDLKSAASGELVWRGSQSFESTDTGADLEQEIADTVSEILALYPPAAE